MFFFLNYYLEQFIIFMAYEDKEGPQIVSAAREHRQQSNILNKAIKQYSMYLHTHTHMQNNTQVLRMYIQQETYETKQT